MNFTINRTAFISQLNNVLRAISSKTTIPILTGLKMVVDTDRSPIDCEIHWLVTPLLILYKDIL